MFHSAESEFEPCMATLVPDGQSWSSLSHLIAEQPYSKLSPFARLRSANGTWRARESLLKNGLIRQWSPLLHAPLILLHTFNLRRIL
jgi:hypothetical protein